MPIIFYDYLVNKQEITIFIDRLDAPENHKGKIRQLVDDILHQGIMEFILQKLHPHQHRIFLDRVNNVPYDPEIISFLRDHVGSEIEKEIEKESNKILEEIKKDFSEN